MTSSASSEQQGEYAPDPRLVEETKLQIRSLVAEIAELSRSDVAPLEYYTEFLNRVVQALAAIGGAVWAPGDTGALELQYQINLQRTGLAENPQHLQQHGRMLHQVIQSGDGMLVAPHSGAAGADQAGNPTEFLLVMVPLKVEQKVQGIVEVFQRPGGRPETQRGYLKFLLQMGDLAADYLKSRQLRQYTDREQLWSQLENFTRTAHTSLELRETAYTIANEGRRLIECDRVSVALRKGRHCRIEAISGQDTFDKRSNTVLMLNRLATAVVRTGDPLWYTGDTEDFAPQVEEAIQAYVDDSHSKTVIVLPLRRPRPPGEKSEREDIVGALIVEQIENARTSAGMQHRVDVVAEHSALALANAQAHHQLFLMPVWRTLGKARHALGAHTVPKAVGILAALAVAAVLLCTVPKDFELEGRGRLLPVKRQNVFAKVDGIVTKLHVEHGTEVKENALLAELRNTDLNVRIEGVLGQKASTQNQIDAFLHMLHGKEVDEKQRAEVYAQIPPLEETLKSLDAQLKILVEEQQNLQVLSPADGIITSWDVERTLNRRLVKKGQRLLEVADPQGDWELEIKLPEDRVGHVERAQVAAGDRPLLVKYILMTDPGTERVGTVEEIHGAAEVRGEEGNTILLRVKIQQEDVPSYSRPGAAVTARIDCGRKPIGYVWFHDLIEFVQSRIL
ncbi:MAG: HlyD family efflux transporter periplasmic adaptor subunit, partial [Planctomycetaceae bacterium]|nr:HlyD family efflux transporter periplasmic adaptor subunit [Planctomycetaceae bacterium]